MGPVEPCFAPHQPDPGARLRHRVRRCLRVPGQRDELAIVQVRQLHPAGAPVGLGLLDPLLRGRHEVPLDEALAQRLAAQRSEEHTSELQSLMRISYAVFCFKKKKLHKTTIYTEEAT